MRNNNDPETCYPPLSPCPGDFSSPGNNDPAASRSWPMVNTGAGPLSLEFDQMKASIETYKNARMLVNSNSRNLNNVLWFDYLNHILNIDILREARSIAIARGKILTQKTIEHFIKRLEADQLKKDQS